MSNAICVVHAIGSYFMKLFTQNRQRTTLVCLIGILMGIILCRCSVIF